MEPLEKNALERLESYEKELRENLKELAPVERDEAIREVRAHVLEAVEAGRESGRGDKEVTDGVLKGFGSPSEYAAEYLATAKSETPKLGLLDKGILFLVKGAAKLWVAFFLGLAYFTAFAFLFGMSVAGIVGGLVVIAYHTHVFPQFSAHTSVGISIYAGILFVIMGICGFYISIRIFIKVVRFHYYYRSSPKRLFTYLKERKGSGFWTLWRIIDIAAVVIILLSFTIGFFTQSTISQGVIMSQVEAKSITPITKESSVERLTTSEADITLKLFGDTNLSAEVASDTASNTSLARFATTYNYDVLRPVLQVTRSGKTASILYLPRGSGKNPGTDMPFNLRDDARLLYTKTSGKRSGTKRPFNSVGIDELNGNKHDVLLSPDATWNLNLQLIGHNADINLAGLTMDKLDLDLLSGDKKMISFSKVNANLNKPASFKSASIENMHGRAEINFAGLKNAKPSALDIRNFSSPLMLRSLGDANPEKFNLASYSDNGVTAYLNGAWSNGTKSLNIVIYDDDLTLLIPKGMQIKLTVENYAGKTKLFDVTSEGAVEYKTPGYDSAPTRLEIKITSHSGQIDVSYMK